MARLVVFLKDWSGWHVGGGIYMDETQADILTEAGIVMDAVEWRKMQAERDKPKIKARAPERPKKDKMVRVPVKKK